MMLLWMMQSNQVQVQTRITDACTSHRPWSNLCIKPSWEINPVQHEATGYKLTCIWSCWSAVMSRTIIENHLNLLFVKRKSNLFSLSLIANAMSLCSQSNSIWNNGCFCKEYVTMWVLLHGCFYRPSSVKFSYDWLHHWALPATLRVKYSVPS